VWQLLKIEGKTILTKKMISQAIYNFNKKFSTAQKINTAALVLFVLTAIFSVGHNKSDEHYQILEFAQYKLGHIAPEDLPWEFSEKMRPTAQPWFVVGVVHVFHAVGITNPFAITRFLRILTAVLLWLVMVKLNKELSLQYFKDKTWATIFSGCAFFLWYVPFVSVRFSSESYAGLFLLATIYMLLKYPERTKFLVAAGFFAGMAILVKAQMGLVIFGLFGWLLFIQRIKWKYILAILLPIIAVTVLGFYLDSQFYNELVVTPYNFIRANLEGGKSNEFGTAPFYYYLLVFFMIVIPPISFVLPFAFFSGMYRLRKNLIVWGIVPFILIHALIAHKEVRFFLPIQYLVLFVTIYALAAYFKDREIKKYQRVFVKTGVVLNMIVLCYMVVKPAKGKVCYQQYLYENSAVGNSTVITTYKDYYQIMGHLNTTFYRPDNLKSHCIDEKDSLGAYLDYQNIDHAYYVHRGYEYKSSTPGYTLEKVYGLYPNFLDQVPFINTDKIRTDTIYLVTKNN